MKRVLELAEKRPVIFALFVTVVLYVGMTGAYVLGGILSGAPYGDLISQAVGKVIATACLALVLWRFGWQQTSGLTRLGGGRAWLLALLPIAYGVAATAYAFFGHLRFSISDPVLALIVARNADEVDQLVANWIRQGHRAAGLGTDVTTPEGRQAIVHSVESRFGGLDILVNNVGTNIRKQANDYTEDEVAHIFRANVSSAWELSRSCFGYLKVIYTAGIGVCYSNPGKIAALQSFEHGLCTYEVLSPISTCGSSLALSRFCGHPHTRHYRSSSADTVRIH